MEATGKQNSKLSFKISYYSNYKISADYKVSNGPTPNRSNEVLETGIKPNGITSY
jgi:hypothetical protein